MIICSNVYRTYLMRVQFIQSTEVIFLLGEGFRYLTRRVSVLVGSISSADMFGTRPHICIILCGKIEIMSFSSNGHILHITYIITLHLNTNSTQTKTPIPSSPYDHSLVVHPQSPTIRLAYPFSYMNIYTPLPLADLQKGQSHRCEPHVGDQAGATSPRPR